MMNRETLYTAIDVGTTKVVTLVARVSPNGGVEILAAGYSTSFGMQKGLVVDSDELSRSVRQSIADAKEVYGKPLPPAFVGVTGAHLSCVNVEASIMRDDGDQAVSDSDVNKLLSSSFDGKQVSAARRMVHIIPRTYVVDGMDGEVGARNPIGLNGTRLSAESHVVLGDREELRSIARVVRKAGVPVRGLVLEHLASAESVLTAHEREVGVVLADSGGGTTDVAVFTDGAVCYTSAIPIAGYHFTNDLALALGLTPEQAEEAKLRYSAALANNKEVDPHVSETIRKLLNERAEELVRLILGRVRDAGFSRVPSGGVVLTGGTSKLPGLAELLAEHGACSVRLGAPTTTLGIPAAMKDASYSTAVGLLLWGIRHQHAGAVALDTSAPISIGKRMRSWFGGRSSDDRSKVPA